jgi:hypothetical protein
VLEPPAEILSKAKDLGIPWNLELSHAIPCVAFDEILQRTKRTEYPLSLFHK